MTIERLAAIGTPALAELSGRARVALMQHQRRIALQQRELQSADRVLAGALSACDAKAQHEMLAAYLEAIQELRVGLQRLESFLIQRLSGRVIVGHGDVIEIHPLEADQDAASAGD